MSEIDYSKLRSLTARKFLQALKSDDFILDRVKGSHHHFINLDGRRVTIPFSKPSDTFGVTLLKYIIESQAHWTEADLKRLKLVK